MLASIEFIIDIESIGIVFFPFLRVFIKAWESKILRQRFIKIQQDAMKTFFALLYNTNIVFLMVSLFSSSFARNTQLIIIT